LPSRRAGCYNPVVIICNHVAQDATAQRRKGGGRVDAAALDALGEVRIDWRFKGFPAASEGVTARRFVAEKRSLADLATPLLVLDEAALAHNIDAMARFCAAHGVDLAPHGKTTMAPQLFARQLAAGAWGITVATAAQARACRAFGVATVLVANQLVDPDGLAWAAAELRRDPTFRLLVFADSTAGVAAMERALRAAGAPRPVDVVIDVGAEGGRTGCRDLAGDTTGAEAVARATHASPVLRLAGVGGFEGVMAADRAPAGLARVRAHLRSMRDTAAALDALGLFADAPEILLTAGGSAYFDDAVALLTATGDDWRPSRPVRTVLRSGAYVTHDSGHYRELTPSGDPDSVLSGAPGPDAAPPRFRPALRLLGRVLSRPEPGLALLDFGKRDAPADLGLPVPLTAHTPDGTPIGLTGAAVSALADQHAFLRLDDPGHPLAVGDLVACGVSHPCTAFDKWRLIPVADPDGHVTELIHTFF
jgi:D-serine deaminase-like pyridoxal phosphate-dependent protein